jgi:hypothetical protein
VGELAFAVKDWRLELLRLHGSAITDQQLHCMQQLQYRLEMLAEKQGVYWDAVRDHAKQALGAFGWS